MFFKGDNEKRLKACIETNGDINLARIRTTPPSDFHPTSATLLYLTKDYYVASMYAGYAERRFHSGKGAVMHIAVPHDLVSAPMEVFGEDWQDLIWHSRHPQVRLDNCSGKLPEHLRKYEDADLLVGPMSSITSRGLENLSDKSGIQVFKQPDGRKTSQWAVANPSLVTQMSSECKGFVWVTPR